ncbi:hypothetical protein BDV93DRAFT_543092 [Ceratobasidium sp. AG-I]|nr:hypothetical protein BDV93DRAFT_543092 [Ceratobasidium sp. AG-I]
MVALTPRFASLLAFIASSSLLMSGAEALPFRDRVHKAKAVSGSSAKNLPMPALVPHYQAERSSTVYADDPVVISGDNNHVHSHTHKRNPKHRHHGDHHRHHGNHHGTKVYADDSLIVSGDNNHVHSHSHKRRHSRHGHHNHHGHHSGTKVYADDPLVVSGDGNHVHSHSHKRHSKHHQHHHAKPLELTAFKRGLSERGLLDAVVPLLGGLPIVGGAIGGVVGLANMLTHTVLSDMLASLIISPTPSAMSVQSLDGEQMPSFTLNASNSSSTTMYLVPQNTTADLSPSEKVVLITMPMFHAKDQTVKTYCASYDPNSSAPSQLSSQPCSYNINAGLDINSTSTHFSQLFSWNTDSGEIKPLWHANTKQPTMQTESTEQPDGFVVGGAPTVTTSDNRKPTSGSVIMIFKSDPAAGGSSAAPGSALAASTLGSSDDCDEDAPDSEDCSDDSDDDSQASQSVGNAPNDEEAPEDVQSYANKPSDKDVRIQSADDATSTLAATATQLDSTPTSTSSAQESADAVVVTSAFAMLVAPTQSTDAFTANASSSSAPSSTKTL